MNLAASLLVRALKTQEMILGPEHALLKTTLHYLGQVYLSQNNHLNAAPLYRRISQLNERMYGYDHTSAIESREKYIECLHWLGWSKEIAKLESGKSQMVSSN